MKHLQDLIHIKAPGNWMNDPNGFIYYKGKYHIFYQHFPYAPVWGTMHWGHAVSSDLIHWEHQGIAIFPSKYYDMNGVFSGNAMEKDGNLYLYYTGIRYPHPNPENIHLAEGDAFEASQVLLISEDGEHFDNFEGKQCVIPPCEDYEIMSRIDTRDPKVWEQDGSYYMMLGSSYHGIGRVIFLQSKDAVCWKPVSQYRSREFGRIFECPDLFELDGQQILFCAATEYLKDGLWGEAQEIYKFVEFDERDCHMTWETESRFLDYGMDLYATQTTLDAEGNRVLIAWMRMPEPVEDAERGIFSGIMTMPRVMSVRNHHLYQEPHPNIAGMFTEDITEAVLASRSSGIILKGAEQVRIICPGKEYQEERNAAEPLQTDIGERTLQERKLPYLISAELPEHGEIAIHGYRIIRQADCILTDRSKVYPKGSYRTQLHTPKLQDGNHLDIYVDRNIIEIYVNHGEYVLSNIIYE